MQVLKAIQTRSDDHQRVFDRHSPASLHEVCDGTIGKSHHNEWMPLEQSLVSVLNNRRVIE